MATTLDRALLVQPEPTQPSTTDTEPTAQSPVHVQIRKGTSSTTLEPFRSITVDSDVTTLAQMREHLQKLNFMTQDDSFLNKSLYVIHEASEEHTAWKEELKSDDSGDLGALSILAKVKASAPVTAPDGTLRFFKGTSVDDLKPFKALKVDSEKTKTLADLRTKLGSDIARSDRFLTTDNFPVHVDNEKEINWADTLQPKAEGKDDSGAIAILGTGSKPSIPPPTLPEKHEFTPLPDAKTLIMPVAKETPTAEAYAGSPQPNAKMLSEDQAKTVVRLFPDALCFFLG